MQLVQGETGAGSAETEGHRAKEAAAQTWKAAWETGNNEVSNEWKVT